MEQHDYQWMKDQLHEMAEKWRASNDEWREMFDYYRTELERSRAEATRLQAEVDRLRETVTVLGEQSVLYGHQRCHCGAVALSGTDACGDCINDMIRVTVQRHPVTLDGCGHPTYDGYACDGCVTDLIEREFGRSNNGHQIG